MKDIIIIFAIYFIGFLPTYILGMKRINYVDKKVDGMGREERSTQEIGLAILVPFSWAGIPMLGFIILLNKFIKFINKKFNLT